MRIKINISLFRQNAEEAALIDAKEYSEPLQGVFGRKHGRHGGRARGA